MLYIFVFLSLLTSVEELSEGLGAIRSDYRLEGVQFVDTRGESADAVPSDNSDGGSLPVLHICEKKSRSGNLFRFLGGSRKPTRFA